VEGVLKEAIDSDVVTVVDIIISPDEKVSPMVPAGASLSEILELEKVDQAAGIQRSYPGYPASEVLELEG